MNAVLKVALAMAALAINSTKAFQPTDLVRKMSIAATWMVLPNFDHLL